jgi:hypothetical protein
MKFKIFHKANFLGEFQGEGFYKTNEVIALGSKITLAKDTFNVRNIMVRKNGDVVLEVSK